MAAATLTANGLEDVSSLYRLFVDTASGVSSARAAMPSASKAAKTTCRIPIAISFREARACSVHNHGDAQTIGLIALGLLVVAVVITDLESRI